MAQFLTLPQQVKKNKDDIQELKDTGISQDGKLDKDTSVTSHNKVMIKSADGTNNSFAIDVRQTFGADAIVQRKYNSLIPIVSGNTASRPFVVLNAGDQYFNTETGYLQVYNGTSWEDVATIQDLSTVFKYMGSVATYASLPSTGQKTGDVWNVTDTGKNFAWSGSVWDDLGGIADLSNYIPKTDIVDNLTTNDATKPLSAKQGKALQDSKVTANAGIPPGTFPKVTIDSKGLVTNGQNLEALDIPTLDAAKITTGQFSDHRIASASTWNAKVAEAPTDGKAYVRVNGAWVADIITNIGTFDEPYDIITHVLVNNLPTGLYKANVESNDGFEVIINYHRSLTYASATVLSFNSLNVFEIDLTGPTIIRNDMFDFNAETLPYDNSGSGLLATDVAEAIDELSSRIDGVVNDISVFVETWNTATKTLALSDSNKLFRCSYASNQTLTIPANATVSFPIGTMITFLLIGTYKVTFVGASGVTLTSMDSLVELATQYGMASLIKINTNDWQLVGALE